MSRNLGIDPGVLFVIALAGMTQLRGHNSTPAKEELKKRWCVILCLFLLTQIPASISAQTLPEVQPGTFVSALTGPSTRPQLDASENENNTDELPGGGAGMKLGRLTVLPDDGRALYFSAIDAATDRIRIEICVLEDPQILQHLQAALSRGVRVRVIVDRGKYSALDAEQQNLALYLTSAGGQLHLSNPVFPRSFPKIILIDSKLFVYGSACLDETTFMQYRDFATANTDAQTLDELERLFENDWTYSAEVGQPPPPFNPTARISGNDLMISPVNSADRLVRLYQKAKQTLDVYTELLGNLTLESELFAAVKRGVRVRLIAPVQVNGATPEVHQLQTDSLKVLAAAGVHIHVSGPQETAQLPYMHARAAIVDGRIAYLGSVSLSPDSITFNREMGLISRQPLLIHGLDAQFQSDYLSRTKSYPPPED